MSKPDPALLDQHRYPFKTALMPRFGDLDVNLHLNNVAIASMLEETRVRFLRETGLDAIQNGAPAMVANLTIDFLGQAQYPSRLDFHSGLISLGRTSYVLAQLAIQNGQPVFLGRTVLVAVGPEGPVALRSDAAVRLSTWMFAR